MDDVEDLRPNYSGIESPFFFDRLLKATKGSGQCGSDVQFYAKYPGELFDEIIHALVQLYEPDVKRQGDAKFLPFESVLNLPASWWKSFKSLQPSCPISIDVFVRFRDAWWGIMWPGSDEKPNVKQRAIRREVLEEVMLLREWLPATGMHAKPPLTKEPVRRQPPIVTTPTHNENYDSVNWYGAEHAFTTKQAAAIKVLWKAWKAGRPSVHGIELIDAAESSGKRPRDIFRSGSITHPAWGTMIVKEGGSHYKLSPPKVSESK